MYKFYTKRKQICRFVIIESFRTFPPSKGDQHNIKAADSVQNFKKQLKTLLFRK